ncbi:SRPBCC family protein [Limnohabitans sp.]|uniref:SRPBCC family protein n=1 Tax=Limnohabitans sp. TaxID=1907725 RepID=UPI00286F7B06|nr:SRPBCC family protein [Limnohabitans sp.]
MAQNNRVHGMKQWWCAWWMAFAGLVGAAETEDYKIKVDVTQQGAVFQTQASFYVPLSVCQSYRYLTDYDAATHIPGVVSSVTTRMEARKARVERGLQERILFFPIKMRMVLEMTELPNQGTDFVQLSGETKFYKGSWRLESEGTGTVFKYRAESEPDSLLPKVVIEYFIKNRLSSSFEAMAKAGAERIKQLC